MSKKIALVLSGCGGLDGAEIQESVCSILAIEREGMSWEAFALDENQSKVMCHFQNKKLDQERNIMHESARIVHGKIKSLTELNINDYDVIWFPGGFGIVSSFSNIIDEGINGKAHRLIKEAIEQAFFSKKVIVGLCISPALFATCLKGHVLTITLGKDMKYVNMLQQLGHKSVCVSSDEFVYDSANMIYTTPAYMDPDASCSKIFSACEGIVSSISSGK